jgi:hypothetical protein
MSRHIFAGKKYMLRYAEAISGVSVPLDSLVIEPVKLETE